MGKNNKVLLNGVISAIRYFKTKNDKDAVGMSLGTRESYKDDEGSWQDRATVFHNDIFGFSDKMVEHSRQFAKGDIVEIEAELEYRRIVDDKGNKKNLASIILKKLEKKITKE